MKLSPVKSGDHLSWERIFTIEDVLVFAEMSGDKGRHHIEKDSSGRLMVHGLLTLSMVTKLGGDINFILREMTVELFRPVFTGDSIKCNLFIDEVINDVDRYHVKYSTSFLHQNGKEILKGHGHGVILKK